jgi:large subunit ribosomal protein L10
MAKSRQQKEELLAVYKEIVSSTDFVVVSTAVLPAAALTNLRKQLSASHSHFFVLKNRLFKLATQSNPQFKDITFAGNYGVLTSTGDITAALKTLEDGKKLMKEELMIKTANPDDLASYVPYTFVMGYVQGQLLDAAGVERLRSLPSREVLLAQFMGLLNAPLTGFMNVLRGNVRQLAYALNDLSTKK